MSVAPWQMRHERLTGLFPQREVHDLTTNVLVANLIRIEKVIAELLSDNVADKGPADVDPGKDCQSKDVANGWLQKL